MNVLRKEPPEVKPGDLVCFTPVTGGNCLGVVLEVFFDMNRHSERSLTSELFPSPREIRILVDGAEMKLRSNLVFKMFVVL